MIAAGVVGGVLAVAGYLGWHHNNQQIERQQRFINFILFSIVLLVVLLAITDVAILVYFNTTNGDTYTGLFRKYVERLLNLEPRTQWDNQTILFMVIVLCVNVFFFGLLALLVSSRRGAPLIHIGDNHCCSIVAKFSVGAAAVTVVIALAVWSVY